MNTLATVNQLQQFLGFSGDNARVYEVLRAATTQIERLAHRAFSPHKKRIQHTLHDTGELILRDDLLVLISITCRNGADVDVWPVHEHPASYLMLKSRWAFFWRGAVVVTGLWGWHESYNAAWRDSADRLATALDSTGTKLLVGLAHLPDTAGEAPRFQVGQLIRIEDEFMAVTNIELDDEGADTLTVVRGFKGTEAAPHPLNAKIDIYLPPEEARSLGLQWASWLYREPDYHQMSDIPPALTKALRPLIRERV